MASKLQARHGALADPDRASGALNDGYATAGTTLVQVALGLGLGMLAVLFT